MRTLVSSYYYLYYREHPFTGERKICIFRHKIFLSPAPSTRLDLRCRRSMPAIMATAQLEKSGLNPVTNEARTAKIMLLDRSGLRLLDPGTDMNLVGR